MNSGGEWCGPKQVFSFCFAQATVNLVSPPPSPLESHVESKGRTYKPR